MWQDNKLVNFIIRYNTEVMMQKNNNVILVVYIFINHLIYIYITLLTEVKIVKYLFINQDWNIYYYTSCSMLFKL